MITHEIPIQAVAQEEEASRYRGWFFLAMLYLFVDYVRPQDVLPFLGYLRPGAITIVLLTGCVVFSGKIHLSWNHQTRLIWAFIILLFIHVPFARNHYYALIAAQGMLKFMPFILSVVILVDSIDRLKKLIFFSIVIMVYSCIYGITHGGLGSGGWFMDENDLSLYINSMIPFVVHLYYQEEKKFKKLAYIGILVMAITTIVISNSRGGFVGFVAVLFVGWFISRRRIRNFLIIALLSLVFLSFVGEEYKQEMSTVTDTKSGTIHGRIMTWKVARNMFFHYPFGVGGNNFPLYFEDFQTKEFKRGMWGRVAHSLWYTLLPELGIPGVIIYFLIIYYNIKDLIFLKLLSESQDRELHYLYTLSLAFMASFAGFFVSATGLSVLYYPQFWYLTAFLIVTKKVAEARLNELGSYIGKDNEQLQGAPLSV